MLTFVKADFAREAVKRIAASNDHKTTILGVVAGLLIAAQLDWGKLVNGDSVEMGKAAGAVVAGLVGYYTNKPDTKAAA